MIPVLDNKFKVKTKEDMIRLYILIRSFELGHHSEKSELDVLVHLYNNGGINGKEDNKNFIEYCVTNNFRGSAQSVRNVLSTYTELGLLEKPKNCIRHFKEIKLKELPEKFVLKYFITNL